MADSAGEDMKRVLLSWSTGKDSAWMLHLLRQQPGVELIGLLTTFNELAERVAMHAVRRCLAERQAEILGLPLWPVPIPSPCTNQEYERRMASLCERAVASGVTHVAFGDLFLEDIRDYRIRQLQGTGLEPLFPIWCGEYETATLARKMIAAGTRAVVTCVDPRSLPPEIAGRDFDDLLLDQFPPAVDPCGERGEFHTFCYDGPMFPEPVPVQVGEIVVRDGFVFADVNATGSSPE
jgi:uncharacterized protein (TIGR00290 family)